MLLKVIFNYYIDLGNNPKTINLQDKSLKLSSIQQFLPQKSIEISNENKNKKLNIKEDKTDSIIDSFVIKTKTGKHPDGI